MTKGTFVQTNNYSSNFTFIDNGIIQFERHHQFNKKFKSTEAFGEFWTLAFGNIQPNQVYVYHDGNKIELSGPVIIYTPPFAIIEWEIFSQKIQWYGILGLQKLPISLPNYSIAFQLNKLPTFKNKNNITHFLAQLKNPITIEKNLKNATKASEIKNILLKYPQDSLKNIASRLNLSLEGMGRIFKRSYGMTPQTYRNKLRIFNSQILMLLKNYSVTNACLEVGFSDVSGFNRQFKKEIGGRPSLFINLRYPQANS